MKTLVCGYICTVLLLFAGVSFADDIQDEDARAKFKEGTYLYQSGNIDEAIEAFREAYRLNPNWRILYNIGQVESMAKHHALALEAFEAYLSKGGDDILEDRRKELFIEIDRLRRMMSYLEIVAPVGSTIIIDGIVRGTSSGSQLFSIAGGVSHDVVVKRDNLQLYARPVLIPGGQKIVINVSEQEDTKTTSSYNDKSETPLDTSSSQEVSQPAPAEPASKLRKTGRITLGTGVVLLLGGAITGITALSTKSEVDEACPDGCYSEDYDSLDKMEKLALTTDILVGVGVGALVVGTIMILTDNKRNRQNKKRESIISPTVSSNSFGAVALWRF